MGAMSAVIPLTDAEDAVSLPRELKLGVADADLQVIEVHALFLSLADATRCGEKIWLAVHC